MPNLKDIRKRISSVKNTRKITNAMKMVSVAKLRRAQMAAENARPYARKMNQVITSLVERVDPDAHSLLQEHDIEDNGLIIVISSDRGLCGGYNANLFRTIDKFVNDRKYSGLDFHMATVGRKANSHYNRNEPDIHTNYTGIIGDVSFKGAKKIADEAMEAFTSGTFDTVHLVYNEFISAIQYETIVHRLLPLTIEDLDEQASERDDDEAEVKPGATEYIFEPDEEALLEQLLPSHVRVQVLRGLLEAEASEHAARMTAMDNATTNAEEMISELTLQYNRARQAYITKELVEIVSGAEALKD